MVILKLKMQEILFLFVIYLAHSRSLDSIVSMTEDKSHCLTPME